MVLLALVPFVCLFALGFAVGWLAGTGRKLSAVVVLVVGGFALLIVYAVMLSPVFSIQNTIR